jgi:hypothetical protein
LAIRRAFAEKSKLKQLTSDLEKLFISNSVLFVNGQLCSVWSFAFISHCLLGNCNL